MRERTIVNVVDALRTQNRLIVHLDCKHNASVWEKDLIADSRGATRFAKGAQFNCDACPDPPPPTAAELRQAKTATQLWKEAGEP